MNKKIILFFLAIIISGIASIFLYLNSVGHDNYILVGENKIFVEIADNDTKRAQGLSGREKMDFDHGMLFIYEGAGNYPFWMKDMKFSLDFIWILNNKVVGLSRNIPFPSSPYEQPATVFPQKQIDMILEVNSGFIDQNNIKIDDKVVIFAKRG